MADVFCIIEKSGPLSKPTTKTGLTAPLVYNNSQAHSMRYVAYENGPLDLTGMNVTASFMKSNNETVEPIIGAISENVAEVVLPASCYVTPGRFVFTMNLNKPTPTTGIDAFSTSVAYAKGDLVVYSDAVYRFTAAHAAGAWTGTDAVLDCASRTVMWVEGIVQRNTTNTIVDPGTPVGNIDTAIGNAQAAATAANTAAAAANTAAETAEDVAESIKDTIDYITDQTGLETNVTADITLTDGKFIVSNTGAESNAYADYSRSELVDVSGYDTVRITMPAVTMSSTNMGLAFYAADETYISGQRVEYGQLAAGFLTAEYPVPANAKYFRASWFSSDGDFSTLYGDFACMLIKKPQKAGRYVPTWNAGGLSPSTGLPSSNSKRIYSDWRHINSGDGVISCTNGYTFGVFCKNAIGSYLGWFNQRTALFSVSAITGYTSIDTQWLIAHGVDQISIVLISASDISTSAGSNVTWTCDQGAADATTALEQIGRIDALSRDIAVVETSPATSAHGAGDYIIFDGQLYEVISEIAAGETLTANSNIESRTLGDIISYIKLFNAIGIFDSVDSLENGNYVLRAKKMTNGKRLYWEPVE